MRGCSGSRKGVWPSVEGASNEKHMAQDKRPTRTPPRRPTSAGGEASELRCQTSMLDYADPSRLTGWMNERDAHDGGYAQAGRVGDFARCNQKLASTEHTAQVSTEPQPCVPSPICYRQFLLLHDTSPAWAMDARQADGWCWVRSSGQGPAGRASCCDGEFLGRRCLGSSGYIPGQAGVGGERHGVVGVVVC